MKVTININGVDVEIQLTPEQEALAIKQTAPYNDTTLTTSLGTTMLFNTYDNVSASITDKTIDALNRLSIYQSHAETKAPETSIVESYSSSSSDSSSSSSSSD